MDELLFKAVQEGNAEAVKSLLDGGVDANVKDNFDYTPIAYAAHNGYTEIVRLLIGKGANVNVIDNDGDTPLTYAMEANHTDIIKLLEEHGAEIGDYTPNSVERGNMSLRVLSFVLLIAALALAAYFIF